MDVLRTAYKADMRLRRDSSALTRVRWFRADPAAKWLPYSSPWGSSEWDASWSKHAGVGEQANVGYLDGALPTDYPGDHTCGAEEAIRHGATSADPVLGPATDGTLIRNLCVMPPSHRKGDVIPCRDTICAVHPQEALYAVSELTGLIVPFGNVAYFPAGTDFPADNQPICCGRKPADRAELNLAIQFDDGLEFPTLDLAIAFRSQEFHVHYDDAALDLAIRFDAEEARPGYYDLALAVRFDAEEAAGHADLANLALAVRFDAEEAAGHADLASLALAVRFDAEETHVVFDDALLAFAVRFDAAEFHVHYDLASLALAMRFDAEEGKGKLDSATLALAIRFDAVEVYTPGDPVIKECVDIPFTSFQIAGTSKTVTVVSLPAHCFLHSIYARVTIQFAGTGLLTLQLQLKWGGNLVTGFMDGLNATLDCQSADAQGATLRSNMPSAQNLGVGSPTAAKLIEVTATSNGANLSVLSAGNIKVCYEYTQY